jgi:hypothetical protein
MIDHLYRFRPLSLVLGGELLNQQIYFAKSENLNDPMEGFRDIFWRGDAIVGRIRIGLRKTKNKRNVECLILRITSDGLWHIASPNAVLRLVDRKRRREVKPTRLTLIGRDRPTCHTLSAGQFLSKCLPIDLHQPGDR